jgi:hypothetical protein
MIKNSKGVALPIALLVMFVLSILGTVIWQYSMTDTIQVARTENTMKAFYIARSGAEATAAWMMDENNSGYSLFNKVASDNVFGDGTYDVKVNEIEGNRVRIDSTANVNGVFAKTSLVLKKLPPLPLGTPITTSTIVAVDKITVGGNVTIDGALECNQITTNGNPTVGEKIDLSFDPPDKVFPSEDSDSPRYLPKASPYNLTLGTSGEEFISSGKYGNIESNGTTLAFDTTDGHDKTIWVDTLQTRNANIRIEGEGTVYIYVNELINLKGHSNYVEEDGEYTAGNPAQFIIFLYEGSSASLPKGDSMFSGHVYGPKAHVNFEGTQNFKGTIISGTTSVSGNATVGQTLFDYEYLLPDGLEFVSDFEVEYWLPS